MVGGSSRGHAIPKEDACVCLSHNHPGACTSDSQKVAVLCRECCESSLLDPDETAHHRRVYLCATLPAEQQRWIYTGSCKALSGSPTCCTHCHRSVFPGGTAAEILSTDDHWVLCLHLTLRNEPAESRAGFNKAFHSRPGMMSASY